MITLDHVSKLYKSSARPALDNVSVKIDKGEFVFLIGPSGSGKSTFMRLLLRAGGIRRGAIDGAGPAGRRRFRPRAGCCTACETVGTVARPARDREVLGHRSQKLCVLR
jgi:ABC-type nitrate/sulfonate/bicarbonate transport system ATPase subunit